MFKPRVACLAALLSLCPTLPCLADGTFVWRNERVDIREPTQKALILFDHGLEDLVLEVRYEGAPDSFGWIVPLPSRPRMRADDSTLFAALSQLTQEPRASFSRRVARMKTTLGTSAAADVRVLERARVGIYDAAVLSGSDGTALSGWLDLHGFRVPAGARTVFQDYAERGWLFVALRIAPGRRDSAARNALASGTVQPVRFRFSTPQPIYPLRVSALNRSASEVLLYVIARQPLVHRTCDRAAWNEHACGPMPAYIPVDPDSAFPGLANGQGFLTKLRAIVQPEQMEDMRFRPYDPMTGLTSTDARLRIESAAHLGWLKPRGAVAALTRFVSEQSGEDNDILTALWALGENGGQEAVAALTSVAEHGATHARIEAVESLARLRSIASLPVFVGCLCNPSDHSSPAVGDDYVHKACFDHLMSQADSSCIAPLRRMLDEKPLASEDPPYRMGPTRRERILAALAAAGDRTARDSIVDRLVAGARSTTREALARSIRPGGTVNDFPSGFWPGLVMITRGLDWGWSWTVPDASRRTWPDIELWNALLAARPSLHDDVLRRTAADPRVPDLGRAMLLGLLLQPRQDDTATLLAIARRGMAKDSLCIALPVGMKRNQHVVRFNVPLCTAAYALGRHRAVDALTALWRECPPDDHDLRGELTVALCQADTGLVVPLLVEYMRSDWNERAGSAAYVKDVLASAQARPPFTAYARLPGQHDLRVIDEPYRVAGITSQIAHRAEPESLISLITDPSLNPWLRLFWVFQTYTAREDMRPWVPALRGALAEMASKTTDGDSLRTGIDGARSWLDIGDKVYGEHSERVSARKLDWR